MQNKFISYEEVDKQMKDIEDLGNSLKIQLNILERHLIYIFLQIKDCKSNQEAEWWFECLDRIQNGLAVLVYTHQLSLSDRLHRFISDFDNFEEAKEHYFEKIRSGEYSFEKYSHAEREPFHPLS